MGDPNNRISNLAQQLGVTEPQLRIAGGALIGGTALVAGILSSGTRKPYKLTKPDVNDKETLGKYKKEEGPFWTWDCRKESKIIYPKKGPASLAQCPPTTMVDMLNSVVKRCPNALALAVERPLPPNDGLGAAALPLEQWKRWTYLDYVNDVKTAAKAFMAFGTEFYGSTTIFGFNAPEWFISSLASMVIGGKCAGIYPTDTVEHCTFKNKHSGATVCVVESDDKAQMIIDNHDKCDCVKAVIIYDMASKIKEITDEKAPIRVMKWSTMMKWGKSLKNDAELEDRMKKVKATQCASIVYTSGTTGDPKGVMLSHDNITSTIFIFLQRIRSEIGSGPQRVISYLPLPHVAGWFAELGLPLTWSAKFGPEGSSTAVYFARPYDLKDGTLGSRLAFVKPTVFVGVPRVYEKISEKMKAIAATVHGPMKKISTWAKEKNLEHARNCQLGGSGDYPKHYGLADFIMGKVRAKLGLHEAKYCISGAAPIMRETLEYFSQLGITITEIYGMSESSGPTTMNANSCLLWNTIGFAPLGVECRVFNTMELKQKGFQSVPNAKDIYSPSEEEQGELCFRGRNIMMGYLANNDLGEDHIKEIEKKNSETITEEGWLMSGDKACMNREGMFRITGRYKELLITAGGENVAPVPIEDWIKSNYGAISNVMMVGDKLKYNVVLITLKSKGATGELPGTDELDGEALKINPSNVTKVSQAMKDQKFLDYCKQAIAEVNKQPKVVISNASKVQDFRILPRDFSISTGEFTPTLKLKRSVAVKMWEEVIKTMY